MLRTRLFKYFALLMIVFGAVSAVVGIRMIQGRVVAEAQTRVRLDLESARAVYNNRLNEIEIVLKLLAVKKDVVEAALTGDWTRDDLDKRLDVIRRNFGFDFLGVATSGGRVALRAAPPHNWDDLLKDSGAIASALNGKALVGTEIWSGSQLNREAGGLGDRAVIRIAPTPRARTDAKIREDRGLILVGAVPIFDGPRLSGVIYGGALLNQNNELVDTVLDVVFTPEAHQDVPDGTATVFLDDCRIATTVLTTNGTRAIGTRASCEVADRVLDCGASWIGRAYVVRDWFLTAYGPIRDTRNNIVGMLYVGIPEAPFRALGKSLALRYAALLLFGLLLSLWLAYALAHRLSTPIHRLAKAARNMQEGEPPVPVEPNGVCDETDRLIRQFNDMADALTRREARLKEANVQLEKANAALRALNESYMNVVGFVSHELQSPVATMMNYAYALREGTLGPLTPEQTKVVDHIETHIHSMTEMVRHYLNLSRIENGIWTPVPARVAVRDEIAQPLLDEHAQEIRNRRLRVENTLSPDLFARADPRMIREAFENLIGNAIQYGKPDGTIILSAEPVGSRIAFSIRNDGPHIPADQLNKLFRKFSRLEPPRGARRQKGTGLGLFITRHIVEAHGGQITVTSDPEGWTDFRFTLPNDQE